MLSYRGHFSVVKSLFLAGHKTYRNSGHAYSKWPRAVLGFCSAAEVLAPFSRRGRNLFSIPLSEAGMKSRRHSIKNSHSLSPDTDAQPYVSDRPPTDRDDEGNGEFDDDFDGAFDDELQDEDIDTEADDAEFEDADLEVFLADDDELDPLPGYGDFWDQDDE